MTTQVRITTHKTQIGFKSVLHLFFGARRGYSVRANFPDRVNRNDALADGIARARDMAETNGQTFKQTHRNAGVIAA